MQDEISAAHLSNELFEGYSGHVSVDWRKVLLRKEIKAFYQLNSYSCMHTCKVNHLYNCLATFLKIVSLIHQLFHVLAGRTEEALHPIRTVENKKYGSRKSASFEKTNSDGRSREGNREDTNGLWNKYINLPTGNHLHAEWKWKNYKSSKWRRLDVGYVALSYRMSNWNRVKIDASEQGQQRYAIHLDFEPLSHSIT